MKNTQFTRRQLQKAGSGKPKGLDFLDGATFERITSTDKKSVWRVEILSSHLKKLVALAAKAKELRQANTKLRFENQRLRATIAGLKARISASGGHVIDDGFGHHEKVSPPNAFTIADERQFKATSNKPLPGGGSKKAKRS